MSIPTGNDQPYPVPAAGPLLPPYGWYPDGQKTSAGSATLRLWDGNNWVGESYPPDKTGRRPRDFLGDLTGYMLLGGMIAWSASGIIGAINNYFGTVLVELAILNYAAIIAVLVVATTRRTATKIPQSKLSKQAFAVVVFFAITAVPLFLLVGIRSTNWAHGYFL